MKRRISSGARLRGPIEASSMRIRRQFLLRDLITFKIHASSMTTSLPRYEPTLKG